MNKNFTKYTCTECGQMHEEWPALTYGSPTYYHNLTEVEKQTIGELNDDFCIVKQPDQTHRFIRCTLSQKIMGQCETLEYGLWVSLSEKSFNDYSDNFHNDNHSAIYFGWLNNNLPQYTFDDSIPTTVHTRGVNKRPEIIPHEDFEHPFVQDYYNGISREEAEQRIMDMLRGIEEKL